MENHFTHDFLDNPQSSNDIDDVIDHCVMHTLVRDHREEHQDLVHVASNLETVENEENLGVENGFLQAELHDIEEEDELVEVKTKPSKSFNDPVRETPARKGHPLEPPLDPGGDYGGRIVSSTVPDYKALGKFLLNAPEDIICYTLSNTTQYARWPQSDKLRKMFKTPSPPVMSQEEIRM